MVYTDGIKENKGKTKKQKKLILRKGDSFPGGFVFKICIVLSQVKRRKNTCHCLRAVDIASFIHILPYFESFQWFCFVSVVSFRFSIFLLFCFISFHRVRF